MDVGAARRASGLLSQGIGTVERAIHDDLLDPLPTNRRDTAAFLAGSIRRQVDGAAHAQVSAGIGQTLRVVARRRAHDAALALGGGQQRHPRVRTAHLEGTALLLVLTLEQNIDAGLG